MYFGSLDQYMNFSLEEMQPWLNSREQLTLSSLGTGL